jgi:UPF0176 protein
MNNSKIRNNAQADRLLVAAFYRFVDLPDCAELREPLSQRCVELGLMGTILLAREGINGTIAGTESAVRDFFTQLRQEPRFASVRPRKSWCERMPFHRMKVRLKKEIVSLGVEGIDPNREAGRYVPPEQWNDLISRDDVRVVDTRNDYEFQLGTFEASEDPQTRSFRQFPEWVADNLDPQRDQHVAMFCTGGIRCEKATALLLQKGFRHVYHLEGGILNYLEQVPADDSLWKGECFVFDNRVTVDHDLEAGTTEVCPACRMPVTAEDKASPLFEKHVSCPRCHHRLTAEKREGLLERARQMALAKARGTRHLGQPISLTDEPDTLA